MFNFEKLEAWQKAITFAELVYAATRDFPAEERFGLTSQMRRAAVSVSANIAEGRSRTSRQDQCRFLELAAGSLFEVVSEATLAKRQKLMTEDHFAQVYSAADELSRMLSGLRVSLRG